MNVDCQWISNNLEALFCDGLSDQEDRLARTHIENCQPCRSEVQALIAVDPLIKKYFRQQLAMATAPRRARRSVIYGSAAAVIASVILAFVLRPPSVNTGVPPAPTLTASAPAASLEPPPTIKSDGATDVVRAKPEPSAQPKPDRIEPVVAPDSNAANAPDFLVTDPAGYSRTLEDYRGHVALIGVWGKDQPQSVASLERLYQAFGSDTRLRFVGVSNERIQKPVNTSFPVLYNQGSKLLGLKPGEFVLLDETGSVKLRGSLVNDFDQLRKLLQSQ
ncbi:MAG TPA: hypothetical protein VE422_31950 [Terriglobia bacterium]|nr:hypothetical protein [Terriglobia bacterium]